MKRQTMLPYHRLQLVVFPKVFLCERFPFLENRFVCLRVILLSKMILTLKGWTTNTVASLISQLVY